jgi:hypothetical protein
LIGLAYLSTFAYQVGVLSYYGLPMNYADLSLINVVAMSVILFIIFYIIYLPVILVAEVFPKNKNYLLKQLVNRISVCVLIFIFSAFVDLWTKKMMVAFDVFLVMTIAYYLIMPIVKYKEKISYKEKFARYSEFLEQKQELRYKKKEDTKLLFKYEKVFLTIMKVLIGIVMVVVSLNSIGYKYGEMHNNYLIAKDYSDKAIVYSNDDIYILKSYENNIMDNEFQIVPAERIGTIYKERIGPLKFAENNDGNQQ